MYEQTGTVAATQMKPLRLTSDVAEAVRAASYEGLKALPQRGAEVGGLITGDSFGVLGTSLRIVKTEYLYGPSYRPSERDLPGFSEVVRQSRSEGQAVLAYFRSCTRPKVRVETADEEAIAQVCPDVPFVVLAKPSLSGSAPLFLFFRDGSGAWTGGEELVVEAPQHAAAELAEPPAPKPQKPATPPQRPDMQPTLERPMAPPPPEGFAGAARSNSPGNGPSTPASRARSFSWFVLLAAGVLVSLWLGGLWLARRPRDTGNSPVARFASNDTGAAPRASGALPGQNNAAASGDPSLGLEAREENGMLHVTWKRDSAAARSAISGVIRIADSGRSRVIPLMRSDVTGGSIVYASHSSDVTFRLQFTGRDGESAEEMIRVLGTEPSREAPQVRYLPAVQPPAEPAPKVTPLPAALSAPPAEYRESPRQTTQIASAPAAEPPRLAAEPTAQSVPAVPNSPGGQAPSVQQPMPTPSAAASAPAAPAPRPQPSPSTVAPAPTPAPATARPAAPSPITLPPQPLHKVMPIYSRSPTLPNSGMLPTLPNTPVTVAVVVSVDEKGKVLTAERASDSPSTDAFLSKQAVDAARHWTFSPAMRAGQPVSAEFRINFVFTYNSK